MTKILLTCLFGALVFGTGRAQQTGDSLIQNGSMTDGADVPLGWNKWVGHGDFTIARDTSVFAVGPASLRMEAKDADASAYTPLTSSARPVVISGQVKVDGAFSLATLAVQVFDDSWHQIAYVKVLSISSGNSWSSFEQHIILPPGSHYVLGLGLRGTGTAWLDELSAKPE
jgi:hypothetical protein